MLLPDRYPGTVGRCPERCAEQEHHPSNEPETERNESCSLHGKKNVYTAIIVEFNPAPKKRVTALKHTGHSVFSLLLVGYTVWLRSFQMSATIQVFEGEH